MSDPKLEAALKLRELVQREEKRIKERNLELIDARQNEVDRFTDYLVEHGPEAYLEYQYKRGVQLDSERS